MLLRIFLQFVCYYHVAVLYQYFINCHDSLLFLCKRGLSIRFFLEAKILSDESVVTLTKKEYDLLVYFSLTFKNT